MANFKQLLKQIRDNSPWSASEFICENCLKFNGKIRWSDKLQRWVCKDCYT